LLLLQLRKASIRSIMSVRQFACIIAATTARITVKFHIEDFYEKCVEKIQLPLKIRQKYWALAWKPTYVRFIAASAEFRHKSIYCKNNFILLTLK